MRQAGSYLRAWSGHMTATWFVGGSPQQKWSRRLYCWTQSGREVLRGALKWRKEDIDSAIVCWCVWPVSSLPKWTSTRARTSCIREEPIRSKTRYLWFSCVGEHSLLHSEEAQQRLIRLFVQAQDSLPVLSVPRLLLELIQSEERRVESREEQREQQGGAAHHHGAAT